MILTDLDGVLRIFPSHHNGSVENALGLKPGSFLPIAFQRKFLEPAVAGKITDEQWRQNIIAELSKNLELSAVDRAITRWTAFPGELQNEVHALYLAQKQNCKLSLLTNATTRLNTDLKTLGIYDMFDIIFNTSKIGFAKPDPKSFEHVLKSVEYPAHEILFIDDREENIKAAEALGFRVLFYENYQGLHSALNWR